MFAAIASKDVLLHSCTAKEQHAHSGSAASATLDGEECRRRSSRGTRSRPDRYVTVTQDELEAIAPKATRSIEIEEFVELSEIDPDALRALLLPGAGRRRGQGPTPCSCGPWEDSGKVALGRVVIRTKAVPGGDPAVEKRAGAGHHVVRRRGVPQSDIPGRERRRGARSARSSRWPRRCRVAVGPVSSPTAYQDDYRLRLLDLIEHKAKGQKSSWRPPRSSRPRWST